MILSKKAILSEINKKRVKITPFNIRAVGPASIDLTLGREIRIFKKLNKAVTARSKTDYKKITTRKIIRDKYILKPGDLILGITKEKLTLPDDICAWINSRSRFARLGLMVHITAPFIQPGVSNKQVLEIYNASSHNLEIIPGEKLCQVILQRCEGSAKYGGRFKHQSL